MRGERVGETETKERRYGGDEEEEKEREGMGEKGEEKELWLG